MKIIISEKCGILKGDDEMTKNAGKWKMGREV